MCPTASAAVDSTSQTPLEALAAVNARDVSARLGALRPDPDDGVVAGRRPGCRCECCCVAARDVGGRLIPDGDVVAPGGVDQAPLRTRWPCCCSRWCCTASASVPAAVLWLPVVLLSSAPMPVAVL